MKCRYCGVEGTDQCCMDCAQKITRHQIPKDSPSIDSTAIIRVLIILLVLALGAILTYFSDGLRITSEVDKKYKACKQVTELYRQAQERGDAFTSTIGVNIDCEAGKQACDANMAGAECQLFLDSVRLKDS